MPALKEHAESTQTAIDKKTTTFEEQFDRLKIVLAQRQKFAELKMAGHDVDDEDFDFNVEDADLYSDTTSMTGAMSNISSAKKSNPASLKTR